VSDFPVPQYSRTQVVKAGEALCKPMPWVEERADEYRAIFKIAYDWRSTHAYPMRKFRQDLRNRIKGLKRRGVTAARLKRMKSIRKKLERLNTTLAQIQDIGGCRAIVDTQETLDLLVAQYRSQIGSQKLRTDRSYIEEPRSSGYRSHHLVFDFEPMTSDEEPFRGRRIEIQLRSRIQHSWATAVEAIGLHRNEDLKASEGDADWLRFFQLVSAEFASFEKTGAVPNSPNQRSARVAEIKKLDNKLQAVRRLDTLNQSFKFVEKSGPRFAPYFLVQFNSSTKTMEIMGYDRLARVSEQYGYEETNNMNLNTVVVEVDTINDLKEAYPNYFLDVRLFTENVINIFDGNPLVSKLTRKSMAQTAQGYAANWLRDFAPGMYKKR